MIHRVCLFSQNSLKPLHRNLIPKTILVNKCSKPTKHDSTKSAVEVVLIYLSITLTKYLPSRKPCWQQHTDGQQPNKSTLNVNSKDT